MIAMAADVTESLLLYLDADYDVVVIEPSDLAMFRREYEKLLLPKKRERVDDGSYEILEFVYGLLENGADVDVLSGGDDDGIVYHSHC